MTLSIKNTIVATYLYKACFRSYYIQCTQQFLS